MFLHQNHSQLIKYYGVHRPTCFSCIKKRLRMLYVYLFTEDDKTVSKPDI